ncbi:MAG: tRNA (adenosine(37)-N6)-dimethylallyltransferase MiaA [bacterium]
MDNKLIVILGPTASGKTSLAIKLAKQFSAKSEGEIVSADSRQIYKEMNIGTAKPTKQEQQKITHHLIDIINPNQDFALNQYKKLAISKIKDIQQRNKVPFLVGGTGLYIQAIVDNLEIPEVKPNHKLRKKLEMLDLIELLKMLRKLDPAVIKKIDIHNKRRLIRALEVCLTTGKPFSEQKRTGKPLFDVLQIGLKIDKKTLDQRIDKRVDKMIKDGLITEVRNLLKKYSSTLPSMSGIGYKEITLCLTPELNIEQIKSHTRQYAKRQITWFKRDKRIKWVKDYKEAEKLVSQFLS